MRLPVALVAAAVLIAPLAACGGDSGKTPSPQVAATAPSNPIAAQADVKKAWTDFFNGKTPAAQRAALVEDGASLSAAFAAAAKDPNAKYTTASVTSVTFTDPTHAAVKYDLVVGGRKVLTGADGKAVLVGSQWMVSKATFCQLVTLAAGKVQGC